MSFVQACSCWCSGFLPESHIIYNFNQNNRKDYLSDLRRASFTSSINGGNSLILDEKFIFSRYLQDEETVIQPIAFVKTGKMFDWQLTKPVELDYLHAKARAQEFVVKPSGGGGGFGIYFIKYDNGWYLEGKKIDDKDLFKKIISTKGALIYRRELQTGFASYINPGSLNTIRILTMIDPSTGEPFIASSVFRCGTVRSGSVDNWSNGGLSVAIDLQNGTLSKGVAFPYGGKLTWYDRHPDTGVQIEGFVIPDWEKLKIAVLDLASKLYFVPYIGWDIVPMDGFFKILEANSNSDVNLLQVHKPLLTSKRVKEFYKYYGVL